MKVDKFIITRFNSIESNSKLLRSSQLRNLSELKPQHLKEESEELYFNTSSVNQNTNAHNSPLTLNQLSDIDSNSNDTNTSKQKSLIYNIIKPSPKSSKHILDIIDIECCDSSSSLDATENWRGQGNASQSIPTISKLPLKKR